MKHLSIIFAASLLSMPLSAQETYENANLATQDLNGTARYVGMGGAMDALGADISTIGTNPAGIGLFRRSTANITASLVSQQGANDFNDADKSKLSLDQAGFVYAMRTGKSSFLNFAFNYHKSRNFNNILSAAGNLNNASQNKLSALKGYLGAFNIRENQNELTGDSRAFSQVDYLYYNALGLYDAGNFYYNNADGYMFDRSSSGYIGEYEFNISGNHNDRIYWGLTVGISDVHYNGYSEYFESLLNEDGNYIGDVGIADNRKITGTGFNVKAGIIFRPIEDSPMRFGLSVATPTWYDLTTSNYTEIGNWTTVGQAESGYISESYDFKLYTPWKFGASFGTTVGNYLAIGAGYEYADYSHLDSRENTGGTYDWYYDEYWESSSSDHDMNNHTKQTLKGVSTFKIGIEAKPIEELAIRAGYNYVSPMYKKDGYKDSTIDSWGSYYASQTDFVNWKDTNRFTFGLGYYLGKFNIDLAYQYTAQNVDFYPFTSYFASSNEDAGMNNICKSAKVDNKRHQVMVTLGYKF